MINEFFFQFVNGIQLLGHSVYGKEFLFSSCVAPQLFGELTHGAMVARLLSVLVFAPKEWKIPLLGILKSWRVLSVLHVLNTKQFIFYVLFWISCFQYQPKFTVVQQPIVKMHDLYGLTKGHLVELFFMSATDKQSHL